MAAGFIGEGSDGFLMVVTPDKDPFKNCECISADDVSENVPDDCVDGFGIGGGFPVAKPRGKRRSPKGRALI